MMGNRQQSHQSAREDTMMGNRQQSHQSAREDMMMGNRQQSHQSAREDTIMGTRVAHADCRERFLQGDASTLGAQHHSVFDQNATHVTASYASLHCVCQAGW